jgi:phasin family protein
LLAGEPLGLVSLPSAPLLHCGQADCWKTRGGDRRGGAFFSVYDGKPRFQQLPCSVLLYGRGLHHWRKCMQQATGSIAGFYRSQVESAQDLTAASMEGFERLQQLTLQAMRQQIDNQFRLMSTVTSRSAEALVDPEIARPAFDRVIELQRQLADTVVRTNQRMLSAVGVSAQRGMEQGSRLPEDGVDIDYSALATTALQQWQELTHRMLDAFHQQFAQATGEIQRQGQRTFDQASEAIQAGTRALQSGAQQAEPAAQTGTQRPRSERKQAETA